MSSFFTAPASQRKRKRQDTTTSATQKRRSTTGPSPGTGRSRDRNPSKRNRTDDASADVDDESISGSDSDDDTNPRRKAANGRNAIPDEEDDSSADDAQETAAERRLKLAERYLDNIRAELQDEGDDVGFNAEDIDAELIAARLKEDVAEEKGHMYRFIAGELDFEHATQTYFRADTLATTGVAVCPPYAYTVSKDMTLIKWELAPPLQGQKAAVTTNGTTPRKPPPPPRRKPKQITYTRGSKKHASDPTYMHHTNAILCVAASASGKLLATGGADKRLIIWDAATLKPLKVFPQHRDAVTAVAFRGKTHQLFSASKDRTLKIWSLDELAYVETLFGHQDEIVDVAAVGGPEERCVSVGARDRSARLWKVVEESQLVFRGGGTGPGAGGESGRRGRDGDPSRRPPHQDLPPTNNNPADDAAPRFAEGSLDRVTQPTTSHFITGSDSGGLSLFALHKKKPLHSVALAHGFDAALPPSLSSAEIDADDAMDVDGGQRRGKSAAGPTPRWITALACVPFSDLVVSGSWDGVVRCWRVVVAGEGPRGAVAGLGKGQGRLEAVGVLGRVEDMVVNGVNDDGDGVVPGGGPGAQTPVRGVINDLQVFLRGDRGKDGACVVAGVGTETRLGRWVQKKGKNGAVVFEVPSRRTVAATASVPVVGVEAKL